MVAIVGGTSLLWGTSGLGVVLLPGRGRRVLVLWVVFGTNVVQGVSVLRIKVSMSVEGTIDMEEESTSNVSGS